MNAFELTDLIREQPFEPLEFEFFNGDKEIVRHPDNVMVFGSYVFIAHYDADPKIPSKPIRYALNHLVKVEPVEPATA